MSNCQFIEINSKIDEIDTFESYTNKFYLLRNNLLMPLINLLFIEDIIGNKPSERAEFAYVLLKNVTKIDWIGQDNLGKKITGRKNNSNKKSNFTDWFTYNTKNQEAYELKVDFDEMWLYIP